VRQFLQPPLLQSSAPVIPGWGSRFRFLFAARLFRPAGQFRPGLDLIAFAAAGQFFNGRAAPGHLLQWRQAVDQQLAKAMFRGPARPEILGKGGGLAAGAFLNQ
jgi:hypothetical protein